MLEKLWELSLDVRYRGGPLHVVADALSRILQHEKLHLSDEDATICQ